MALAALALAVLALSNAPRDQPLIAVTNKRNVLEIFVLEHSKQNGSNYNAAVFTPSCYYFTSRVPGD